MAFGGREWERDMQYLRRLRLAIASWLIPIGCRVVTAEALADFEVRIGERDDPAWDDEALVPYGWDHI